MDRSLRLSQRQQETDKARTRWYRDHSVDLSIPDFEKKSIKKEWTEAIKNVLII